MHGTMAGYDEVRATGPKCERFRLFCILENADAPVLAQRGLPGPAIAVIAGSRKPWRTAFTDADDRRVRDLGSTYRAAHPQRIARPSRCRAPSQPQYGQAASDAMQGQVRGRDWYSKGSDSC